MFTIFYTVLSLCCFFIHISCKSHFGCYLNTFSLLIHLLKFILILFSQFHVLALDLKHRNAKRAIFFIKIHMLLEIFSPKCFTHQVLYLLPVKVFLIGLNLDDYALTVNKFVWIMSYFIESRQIEVIFFVRNIFSWMSWLEIKIPNLVWMFVDDAFTFRVWNIVSVWRMVIDELASTHFEDFHRVK